MDSIMGNNTWVLVDLPPGCKPIWVSNGSSKKELKVDGTIKKFKVRLVIQGFKQKSGIDYFDTYAPVTHISTIRLLIAMASIHNLIIHQMDANTSFLNGEVDEEAPKQWNQKFDEVVLSSGYLLNQADKYVYSKFDETVQVDLTKEFLSSRFSMKDIGEADVILGIRIKHESNEIAISQSHYIENVLKKFNYFDCTPDDPKTFDEAMKSHDVAFWKEAINEEMNSTMGNNTWVLADPVILSSLQICHKLSPSMHRVRLGLRKQEKKAKHAIEVAFGFRLSIHSLDLFHSQHLLRSMRIMPPRKAPVARRAPSARTANNPARNASTIIDAPMSIAAINQLIETRVTEALANQ
ncbi:zinc finger, CCHC-type containing protein, partial [Tanacetum coccineum]